LLAAIGALDPADLPEFADLDDLIDPDDAQEAISQIMLDALRNAVGGQHSLDELDAAPLPDEPFEWTGIPDDIHVPVTDALHRVDRCCDQLLDTEYRTACRRLLARAAAGDPAVFRRSARRHGSSRDLLGDRQGQRPIHQLPRRHAGKGPARPLRTFRQRLATRRNLAQGRRIP
jgi:hypothetical protein